MQRVVDVLVIILFRYNYIEILQVHQLLFAFVACIFDTMHLLGITFILYLLKLSAGNGYMYMYAK